MAALERKAPQITVAIVRKLDVLMAQLKTYIITQKLQGQVLLSHSPPLLAQSVHEIPATVDGKIIRASVEGAGGVAWYGRVHEEGGTTAYDIYPKYKKALAFDVKGEVLAGVISSGRVVVKHVLHPPLPKRPWMGPSLEENRAPITQGVLDAVNEGLAK